VLGIGLSGSRTGIVGGGWLMDEILWTGDIEYAGVGDVGSGVADLV
jgi:hypothetical protein